MKTAAAIVCLCSLAQAQTLELKPLSSGAMQKMGGYRPQRLKLSADKPGTISKLPADLASPTYGVLTIGPAASGKDAPVYHIVLDEPDGKPARLFVDANGNGDLTDDPEVEWKSKEYKVKPPKKEATKDGKDGDAKNEPKEEPKEQAFTQYNGGATVELKNGKETMPAHLGMYRFDKSDPGRAALSDVVLYYADYAREGSLKVGDKSYPVLLTDDSASGDFRGAEGEKAGVRLLVDVNNNGKFESRGEAFDIREPFNLGGTTYEITGMSPLGGSFQLVKSDKKVAEIPTPPDHAVGKKITAFDAETTEGTKVSFPTSYKGKIVMLDFWATWCGPCMGEVPGLVKVYKDLHPQGFEILGITLDNKDALEKLKTVTGEQGMTWQQVYDGGAWKARIAQMYVINSIPAAFLVDGDTGEILASGGSLRGEQLRGTIEKALKTKSRAQLT